MHDADDLQNPGVRDPIVTMRGMVKRFPGVLALDSVDLSLYPGEVHALTGENGSGKSTLAKLLAGTHRADAGVITIDGQVVSIASPRQALSHGIVTISQELTLNPTLSVAENIYLGRVPVGRFGTVSWRSMNAAARELLDRLEVGIDETASVGDLRLELQQEIEIARALSMRGRVLILDEATSSLSEKSAARLMEVVEEQRDKGVAVLMITHRMPEIYRTATRATVLRDGALVDTVGLPHTPERELVCLMVGRELGDYYGSRTSTAPDSGSSAVPALRLSGLRTADGALQPTDLDVRRGEILGVAGLAGCGKLELGLALAGAISSLGTVEVDGAAISLRTPLDARLGGIGYVPDDRKGAALLLERSVTENFSLANMKRLMPFGFLSSALERTVVQRSIERYAVRTASANTTVGVLSGGNQQKIVLGRTFDLGCPVYVLNEPTRGVDVGSKSAIYAFLRAEADRGAAVVLISSELPELLGTSDRIVAMYRGGISGEFTGDRMTEELVNEAAVSGRNAPAVTHQSAL
ncbi:sugar ABC transporter ATP-binding protein [Rhodococcus maanshanensis]|uniref:Ribose transport system ATP-binding protein/rhamnose transport system ATP-binding protein n=1 Tax=Rhodococcus maanshanensis TaxID=183556 RepID=A0A1H7I056_9NOCA|nr:sugar ABC transporter ATP-binding protein [Rhodococcus maanshanensis]SEK55911.1 ribose transport system ATP-binding protein/rhamnose transport system ATP-binding protein [Rhodococcus maanshanensis]